MKILAFLRALDELLSEFFDPPWGYHVSENPKPCSQHKEPDYRKVRAALENALSYLHPDRDGEGLLPVRDDGYLWRLGDDAQILLDYARNCEEAEGLLKELSTTSSVSLERLREVFDWAIYQLGGWIRRTYNTQALMSWKTAEAQLRKVFVEELGG